MTSHGNNEINERASHPLPVDNPPVSNNAQPNAMAQNPLSSAQVSLEAEKEAFEGTRVEFYDQREEEIQRLAEQTASQDARAIAFQREMQMKRASLEEEKHLLIKEREALDRERTSFVQEKAALIAQTLEDLAERKRKAFADLDQELSGEREKLVTQTNALETGWKELRAQQEAFSHERVTAQKELLVSLTEERRNAMEKLGRDLREEYQRVSEQLNKQYQELAALQQEQLDKRRQEGIRELEEDLEKRRQAVTQDIAARYDDMLKREEELNSRQKEQMEISQKLKKIELDLDLREKNLNLRQEKQDEEIENRIGQTRQDLEARIQVLTAHAAEQREQMRSSQELLGKYDILKQELGGKDPALVLAEMQAQAEYINDLRQKLITEPGETIRALADEKNREIEYHKQRADAAQDRLNQLSHLEEKIYRQAVDLEDKVTENERLRQKYELLEAHNAELENELRRYRTQLGEAVDRDARIAAIENNPCTKIPMQGDEIYYLDYDDPQNHTIDEINWLENIAAECLAHGFKFPKRLLYAFHTSLKIAEWSPLTVLAGVSGTGKSELPRLYSLFGGLTFHSLPVQPNWDSQEAMLGFFNAIDNAFDAQPVLQLLAQTQKSSHESRYGLKDAVTLILLDEMNLAHMELYFAEFLSKFESRRGLTRKELPKLNIKLGVNIAPYELPLGRNVLWVGTMNQDETTKSLSDKVLDRGIILHFPRPTTFHRRKELTPLPPYAAQLLPFDAWRQWAPFESRLDPDSIEPFKKFVEQINSHLETVGRALGHRVWQSMEYYMAAYPTVKRMLDRNDCSQQSLEFRHELRTAFEDQLVQKVMPKLRGIETHGTARTNCLDKIREMLSNHNYEIIDDFNKACEVGYGQFMWSSANYLNEKVEEDMLPDEQETA